MIWKAEEEKLNEIIPEAEMLSANAGISVLTETRDVFAACMNDPAVQTSD